MQSKLIKFLIGFQLAILPISNIINQILVSNFNLPSVFFLWKDILLVFFTFLSIFEIIKKKEIKFINLFSLSIVILLNILAIASTLINQVPLYVSILGYRFELFWITCLGIIFAWTNSSDYNFKKSDFYKYFLIGFWLNVALNFFSFFQKDLINSLIANKNELNYTYALNTCHNIDLDNSFCRLSGNFNHPNHFASYLLLVIPVFLFFNRESIKIRLINYTSIITAIFMLYLTDSKSNWIGFFILIVSLILFYTIKNFAIQTKLLLVISLICIFSSSIFLIFNNDVNNVPEFMQKSSSTYEHIILSKTALNIINKDLPRIIVTGYGLGETGTVAKEEYRYFNDSKFFKANENFFYENILPLETAGITENWYYQLILNGGIIYAILYVALLLFIFLYSKNRLLLLGFVPLFFVNSVLHTFESSIVVNLLVLLTIISNTVNYTKYKKF